MCAREDWPCVRDDAHDAPRGCVHVSSTGSDVSDGTHDDTTGDDQ